MHRPKVLHGLVFWLVAACAGGARAQDTAATFEDDVAPFIERYCTRCHGEREQEAKLDLESRLATNGVTAEREVWEKVHRMLAHHEMPPPKARRPSATERARVARWLRAALDTFDCAGGVDPGHATLRRLNRNEYRNTVRDLTGVDFAAAGDFPADEVGYGFDNIGDNLTVPPLLLEKYLDAAHEIVEAAVDREYLALFSPRRLQAEALDYPAGEAQPLGAAALLVGRECEASRELDLALGGDYVLRANAWGQQAGPDPVRMAFRVDGETVKEVAVANEDDAPAVFEAAVTLAAGRRRLGVAYLNNWNEPRHPDPKLRGDRNLVVDWFEVELARPATAPAPRASHRRLLPCAPGDDNFAECARAAITDLARRAFRRPLHEGEIDRFLALVDSAHVAGDSPLDAVLVGLEAVLVSPQFLFRLERQVTDAEPDAGAVPIDDYSLASRLSYFLWSSMPDEELFALAAEGRLQDARVLAAQAERMLADAKAGAFSDNFAGQWLQTRLLRNVTPDPKGFPLFNDALRDAMALETLRFFGAIVAENRSLLELLDADFTFLNEGLARLYGIDDVEGDELRRVSLAGSARGGILTQASFLTLTSNPTRTSPVKRGKWILEQILGTPPLPPPPDVEELPETEEAILSGSLRQRMERHREDPNCAVCHTRMDALGFAFENFDAIGAWRDFDGRFLVDPSGVLPDGKSFHGPDGLKKILQEDREAFARNLAQKMLTYALGRGLEYYDRCAVDEIVQEVAADGWRLRTMLRAVVTTRPFRFRRAE